MLAHRNRLYWIDSLIFLEKKTFFKDVLKAFILKLIRSNRFGDTFHSFQIEMGKFSETPSGQEIPKNSSKIQRPMRFELEDTHTHTKKTNKQRSHRLIFPKWINESKRYNKIDVQQEFFSKRKLEDIKDKCHFFLLPSMRFPRTWFQYFSFHSMGRTKKKNETTISISFYVDAVEVDDDDDGGPKKRPILYQKKSKRKEKKIKIRPPPHFALMEAPRLHPKTKEKRPRIYL